MQAGGSGRGEGKTTRGGRGKTARQWLRRVRPFRIYSSGPTLGSGYAIGGKPVAGACWSERQTKSGDSDDCPKVLMAGLRYA